MVQGFHQNLEQQQAPAFFARGPSPFARLVFFAALSLTLIATDSRLQYLATVRENLMTLLHPLQVVANAPSQLYQLTNEYFSTHHRLLNENEQLKKQALKQAVALQQLNMLMLENANLRDLLQANKALVESTTLAEIMHIGRDPFAKKIIVNRGTNHEVLAGAAVVDATGVIGQVTRTYPSSSEVTLITDKSLAIPVQIQRNGLRAIAFGHGRDNTLNLPYLPANVDIKRGDKLVTSGIDGIYPAGLAVATVSEIKVTSGSPFAQIVCEPTGGIEKRRHVLLVRIPQASEANNNQTPATTSNKNNAEKTQPQKLKEPKQQQNSAKPQPNNPSKPHA